MPLDLPQGHFVNEQPALYVRPFSDPRYGGGERPDNHGGRNVMPNSAPGHDERPIPTSVPSAPGPFVASKASDFSVAADIGRVIKFEKPKDSIGKLRHGTHTTVSAVSAAKPSAKESDALKSEAMKLVEYLQVLIEDLDIDADKLAGERQKVEVRVVEIEAGSSNLRVFVETKIRPFLVMLEKKQNLIGYCENFNATSTALSDVEEKLANPDLHGKERDGVKAKRSGLRKNQRRLIEILVALRRSSRALDKFAESLLEEEYADARDNKLHRRESFLKGKEQQRVLRKRKRLKSQLYEAGTHGYANETNALLGSIGRYAMAVFGTANLGPGKARKRGFHEAKRAKRTLQDEILLKNFSDGEEKEKLGDTEEALEMAAYENEYKAEINDNNRGERAFEHLDYGPVADVRKYMLAKGVIEACFDYYGNICVADTQPLSAQELWKMARDIEYLQSLTAQRVERAKFLRCKNAVYYTRTYPDFEGRELRKRERREEDEALWEIGHDVVSKALESLLNDPLPFEEVGPAFHDRIQAGYNNVDNGFAARRLQVLQAAWAALEGGEEEGDEALAA